MHEKSRMLTMAVAALALTAFNGVAHADGGGGTDPLPQLVALGPIIVPIVEHGEILGRLEVRAMWKTEAQGGGLDTRLPLLRSTLLRAAADHARLAAAPGHAVDPAALSHELGSAARGAGFKGELLVLEASAR